MPETITAYDLQEELERYHYESYGWARSCCARSAVEAETALQSAYLKILAGKARYDGRSSFKTWLFAVIRRTAVEERRLQLLSRLWLARGAAQAPATVPERPDEALYRAELQQLVRQALVALPRRQREVLQLVFYHDLSLAEAAEVMNVSLGSARTHYDRGKQKLRGALKRLLWSLAAAGLVLLSLGGAWLVLNNRAPKQVKPAEALVQQVSPAESVKILAPRALSPIRKPSLPANKRVVTKERRTSPAPQPDLALLSQWRSPTEFLLRTPGAALLKTVPRLGASWIESRTLVPEQKNDLEEQ